MESWQSVPALDVTEDQIHGETRGDWYTGTKLRSMVTHIVSFDYNVDGSTFRGSLASPDGGGLPFNSDFEVAKNPNGDESFLILPKPRGWRAYYHPDNPSLAVLNPIPFRGIGYMVVFSFMGILIAVHLYFKIWG